MPKVVNPINSFFAVWANGLLKKRKEAKGHKDVGHGVQALFFIFFTIYYDYFSLRRRIAVISELKIRWVIVPQMAYTRLSRTQKNRATTSSRRRRPSYSSQGLCRHNSWLRNMRPHHYSYFGKRLVRIDGYQTPRQNYYRLVYAWPYGGLTKRSRRKASLLPWLLGLFFEFERARKGFALLSLSASSNSPLSKQSLHFTVVNTYR